MQSLQSVQEQKEYLPDVGYIIESQLLLSEKEVVDGAKFIGDLNPVHNDPDNEQTIRLGGIIASGSHITAVFSALLPTHFMKFGPMLGAHMDVKFTAPIKPNTIYTMNWVVQSKEYKKSLGGTIYANAGTIIDPAGNVTVRANASIILY